MKQFINSTGRSLLDFNRSTVLYGLMRLLSPHISLARTPFGPTRKFRDNMRIRGLPIAEWSDHPYDTWEVPFDFWVIDEKNLMALSLMDGITGDNGVVIFGSHRRFKDVFPGPYFETEWEAILKKVEEYAER